MTSLAPIIAMLLVACGGSAAPAPASSAGPGASAKPAGNTGASGDINLQAVKSEGKVVGYGVIVDSLWKELNDEMQKAYGIPVENFRGDASAVVGRIEPEEASGQHLWDFEILESPYQDGFAQKGYLQKLPPELTQLVPEKWRDPNGYWAAFTLFPQTIIYNTDLVKPADAPQSMDTMADPKWKGKFAMTDPVLNEAFLRQMQGIREAKGGQADEFFKAVAANNPVFFQSGQTTSTNINQGQYPLGLGFMTHVLSVGGKNGHMQFMKQNPMPAINGAFSISAHPAHPEAMKALERVFLSKGYMEAIAQLGYPVTVPGIQSALPGASDLTYANIPWLEGDKFNEAQTYFKSIFKK